MRAKTLFCGAMLAVALTTTGCTSINDYRKAGLQQYQQVALSYRGDVENYHRSIRIGDLTVNLIGHPSMFPVPEYRDPVRGIAGCADRNAIWVLVRRDQAGRVYINEGLLGHELMHVLHFALPGEVMDPDRLEADHE